MINQHKYFSTSKHLIQRITVYYAILGSDNVIFFHQAKHSREVEQKSDAGLIVIMASMIMLQ